MKNRLFFYGTTVFFAFIIISTAYVIGYPLTEPNTSCYWLCTTNCSLGDNWCKWKNSNDNWKCQAATQVIWQSLFFEDFEKGSLNSTKWEIYSSNPKGRIKATAANNPYSGFYHLAMDVNATGIYNLNELITKKNFAGYNELYLNFWYKHFGDNDHFCPSNWTNHTNGDCIAISCNNHNWYNILNLTGLAGWEVYINRSVNLTSYIISKCNGIVNSSFRIKFQQYDNYHIDIDGRTFDNINISGKRMCECKQITITGGDGGRRPTPMPTPEPTTAPVPTPTPTPTPTPEPIPPPKGRAGPAPKIGTSGINCIDSDGLNYNVKSGAIGAAIIIDSIDYPMIIGLEPEPSEPKPSNKTYSVFYDYCANGKNISEAYCDGEGILRMQTYECAFGCIDSVCRSNIKERAMYAEKQAFLISNSDPILAEILKPVVNWSENQINFQYPLLIYNKTNANEIIERLNELEITKIVVFNESIIKNLINNPNFLNRLLTVESIEEITENDYFSFWKNFIGFVYTEPDIKLIEHASGYASLINAPLIVQGSELDKDKVFLNRYVICIGDNLPQNKCTEYKK
jgi:hypothetical protein